MLAVSIPLLMCFFFGDLQHSTHKSLMVAKIVSQLNIFQALFVIQENKLNRQKEQKAACTKLNKRNDLSSMLAKTKIATWFPSCVLKWLPLGPVVGNVMIETKLFFMTKVSDFLPCNHSTLIVSNHSFINVLVLRFHFFCLNLCNLAVFQSFGRLVGSLVLY